MAFDEAPLLSLDNFVLNNGDFSTLSTHIVKHDIISRLVDLFTSKYAVVQCDGCVIIDKLEYSEISHLSGVEHSGSLSIIEVTWNSDDTLGDRLT